MKPYSLVGVNGNAYSVMGYTANAMRRAGFTTEEVNKMFKEAQKGNYYELIATCDGYINQVNEKLGLSDEDDDDDDKEDYFDEY